MARTGFDPTATNDPTPTKTVGGLYTNRQKEYRYLQMNTIGGVDSSLGQVMQYAGDGIVEPGSVVASALTSDGVAGVGVGVISPGNFGFFQVSGNALVQIPIDNILKGHKAGAAGQVTIATTADAPGTFVGIQIELLVGATALFALRLN